MKTTITTSASGGKHQVIWVELDQGKHSEKHRSNTLHAWRIGLAFRGVFGLYRAQRRVNGVFCGKIFVFWS
jgi:hypothetical protein